MAKNRFSILHTDVLSAFKTMPDNSYHGCLTDPPYGLTTDGGKTGFMGHAWDHGVPPVEVWRELLRVLRPGAHVLAFGGTRTFHRLTCAIEDAGFEVRDCMMWLYGCLSDDTEVLVDGRWEHYSKATTGRLALCYDVANGTYSWQPIAERVEYDYDETAYRITSERTDQIVSRNHRCIVDRGAGWEFSLAEEAARESAVRVPVLQDVQGLLCQLRDAQPHAGASEQDVLEGVRGGGSRTEGAWASIADESQGVPAMRELRQGCAALAVEGGAGSTSVLLRGVQRRTEGEDADTVRPQGPRGLDGGVAAFVHGEDVGPAQPSVEGRSDLLRIARESRGCEVRTMPGSVPANGTEGRLRDGAPACGCASDGAATAALRSGPPHGSQSSEQRGLESGSVRHELGSQAVRGEGFTTSDLAVIEPVHYTGKVWCLRVPTGAFVARRNGKVFVTGNSGFPKSHDVSKAIDREAGAKREVGAEKRTPDGKPYSARTPNSSGEYNDTCQHNSMSGKTRHNTHDTAPATEAARQWEGHGTALKPAWEPIIVARKPLDGTVAQNVQRWGCGGLAIGASRVGEQQRPVMVRTSTQVAANAMSGTSTGATSSGDTTSLGRWPANVILDEEAGQALDAQSGNRKSASNTKPSTGGAIMSGLSGEARANGYRAFADGNPYRGEEGGASRFFKSCDFSQDEVVFSRAMAMLNGCNFDHASIANAHSSQSKLRADSALNDAVTLVSQGATRLLGWSGLSTVATPSESKTLSATLIATILSFGEGSSQEPQHERSFPTGSRASVAQHQRQTDTTTITISHWRSDGSAEPVTFSITPLNSVHGEAGSSRFIYQAKASRAERDAGLDGFDAGQSLYSRGTGLKANGDGSERSETRNIHPTVKPLALARYLARLILPPIPDARMVVPFCGSGSEVIGALQAGWSHVDGIDSWDVAVDIARSRVAHWNKPVEQLDLAGEE